MDARPDRLFRPRSGPLPGLGRQGDFRRGQPRRNFRAPQRQKHAPPAESRAEPALEQGRPAPCPPHSDKFSTWFLCRPRVKFVQQNTGQGLNLFVRVHSPPPAAKKKSMVWCLAACGEVLHLRIGCRMCYRRHILPADIPVKVISTSSRAIGVQMKRFFACWPWWPCSRHWPLKDLRSGAPVCESANPPRPNSGRRW